MITIHKPESVRGSSTYAATIQIGAETIKLQLTVPIALQAKIRNWLGNHVSFGGSPCCSPGEACQCASVEKSFGACFGAMAEIIEEVVDKRTLPHPETWESSPWIATFLAKAFSDPASLNFHHAQRAVTLPFTTISADASDWEDAETLGLALVSALDTQFGRICNIVVSPASIDQGHRCWLRDFRIQRAEDMSSLVYGRR